MDVKTESHALSPNRNELTKKIENPGYTYGLLLGNGAVLKFLAITGFIGVFVLLLITIGTYSSDEQAKAIMQIFYAVGLLITSIFLLFFGNILACLDQIAYNTHPKDEIEF